MKTTSKKNSGGHFVVDSAGDLNYVAGGCCGGGYPHILSPDGAGSDTILTANIIEPTEEDRERFREALERVLGD